MYILKIISFFSAIEVTISIFMQFWFQDLKDVILYCCTCQILEISNDDVSN